MSVGRSLFHSRCVSSSRVRLPFVVQSNTTDISHALMQVSLIVTHYKWYTFGWMAIAKGDGRGITFTTQFGAFSDQSLVGSAAAICRPVGVSVVLMSLVNAGTHTRGSTTQAADPSLSALRTPRVSVRDRSARGRLPPPTPLAVITAATACNVFFHYLRFVSSASLLDKG